MSEERESDVWVAAKYFIIDDLLESDPEYLSVAEYLEDNWDGEDELDQSIIDEVYQEVVRQMPIAAALFNRWEE